MMISSASWRIWIIASQNLCECQRRQSQCTCVSIPVDFFERLGFGGLDEHARRDGPRAGGRVEAVVLETLREVHYLEPGSLVEFGEVDKELVGNPTLAVGVTEGVMSGEAMGHIIRIQEGRTRRISEAGSTEHLNVCPGDKEDGGTSKGSCCDCVNRLVTTSFNKWVRRKERREVGCHADGTDTRSTATMGAAMYRQRNSLNSLMPLTLRRSCASSCDKHLHRKSQGL